MSGQQANGWYEGDTTCHYWEGEVGKDAALRVAVRFDREVMRGAAARALPERTAE